MDKLDPFTLRFTNESQFFSNNTLYSFRTIVNPPILLPFHGWEVALTKMHIPQTRLMFLPASEFEMRIRVSNRSDKNEKFQPIIVHIQMEKDFFTSLERVLERFEQTIQLALLNVYATRPRLYNLRLGLLPGVGFSLEIIQQHVSISAINFTAIPDHLIQKSSFKVISGLELWKQFGFKHIALNTYYPLPIRAMHPPSFNIENSTLSILAPNLVQDQFVGDRIEPLLEMVPYNMNSNREYSFFEQRYPLYKTIQGGYINHIMIDILDVNNIPIYFDSGKLSIELHFRQCLPMIKW